VLIIPYRQPVYTAKILATLDALSGGRLIVGAGAGWVAEKFAALGLSNYAEGGAVTDEYLPLFKELWPEQVSSCSGARKWTARRLFEIWQSAPDAARKVTTVAASGADHLDPVDPAVAHWRSNWAKWGSKQRLKPNMSDAPHSGTTARRVGVPPVEVSGFSQKTALPAQAAASTRSAWVSIRMASPTVRQGPRPGSPPCYHGASRGSPPRRNRHRRSPRARHQNDRRYYPRR
jgi:Luciferase-like monooxygenase